MATLPDVPVLLPPDEVAPVSVDEAIAAAAEGDPLQLDLHASGFYGETEVPEDVLHYLALESLGDLLSRMRQHSIDRRWGTDEQTLLNFAFRFGHHYVEVDRERRGVVATPAPRDTVRRTINKFEPWFTRKHGRLAAGIPAHQIRPKTSQRVDRDASGFAETLAAWRVEHLYSLDHRSEAAMWKLMGGSVVFFVGVEWVPDPGYMVDMGDVDPETGEPAPVHRPDLVEEAIAPQAFWCDDRYNTIEKMPWCGRDRYVRISDARATYPEDEQYLTPMTGRVQRGHNTLRRVQQMTAQTDPWGDATGASADLGLLAEEEEIVLGEFWLKPGEVLSCCYLDALDPATVPFELVIDGRAYGGDPVVRFPEGLRVVFTPEGKVLEVGPNIYERLPFREMGYSKAPGFWRQAPATVLREVQRAINWLASVRDTHAAKVANAPLLVPRDARMHRRGGLLSGLARIFYRPNRFNAKPEYLNVGNLPADFAQAEARMEQVWQDLANDHDVTQGTLPSADLSGVTVSLLQESDLQALGYAGEEQETAFVDLLRMELLWIQKFFPENDPRLVQLAGDAPFKLRAFMQANLEDGLDIQVVKGSSLPRSPAAVEAKAREGWREGWLLDKYGRPDFRLMRELAGFGTDDDFEDEEELDVQNARTEEEMILALDPLLAALVLQVYQTTGILPPPLMPQPEDDPMVHERSHRVTLKQLRKDASADPALVELLRAHWEMTVQILGPLLLQQDPATAMGAAAGQALLAPGQQPEGEESETEGSEEESPAPAASQAA